MGNVFIAISQNAGAGEIKNETNDKSVSTENLEVSEVNSPINRRLTLYEEDSTSPVLVCGDDDVLHMAWIDSRAIDFNSSQIFTSIFYKQSHDFGNTWTPDTVLSTRTTDATSIDLAIDGNYLAIAWEEGGDVFTMFSYDNGNSWAEPYPIYSIESPSIALKGNDVYLVFKDNSQTGVPYLSGKKLTIDPELTTPVPYDFNPAGNVQICSIADVTADENAIYVAIKDQTNAELHFYKSQNNGTTWSGGVIGDSFGEDVQGSVKIANKDDCVNIVWSDNRDGNYDIYMKSSIDNGNSWSSTMKITESLGESSNVDVSLNSKSELNMCWEEISETSNKIYYGKFDSNGNELSLSPITNGASTSSKPMIALDSNDYYYVLWQDDRDADEEIYFSTNLGEFDKQMDSVMAYIELLPDDCFTNVLNKNTLILKLEAVRTQLDEKAYTGALNKLENDIMKKIDGYRNENPKDDWIVDLIIQEELSNLIFSLITYIELKTEATSPIGGSEWCDVGTSTDSVINYGICLYPAEWSSTAYSDGIRTYRYGIPHSNFLINIPTDAKSRNIDYRVTFSFWASSNVPVYQWGGSSLGYKLIGTLPGNSNWKTYSLETFYTQDYDYLSNPQYNLLFDFGVSVYLDSLSVIPVNYNCDVGIANDNVIANHDPGINPYPAEWNSPILLDNRYVRLGPDGSNIYINSPNPNMEYRIEITYKSKDYYSDSGGIFQQWTGAYYSPIGKYICDQQWHTAIFISNKMFYYDYYGNTNVNVLFEFTRELYVDSLKLSVARDYCNVGVTGDNSAILHEPGPSIYPNAEWDPVTSLNGRTCRYGIAGSNMYLNDIDTSKDYIIRITYRSPSYYGLPTAGSFRQWDGAAYHILGTYIADDSWRTITFVAKSMWQYDYGGSSPTYAMNALFEFSRQLWVDDISIGVMEKYAILIGGGDVQSSYNYDMFTNDLFEMYIGLKGYNGWNDNNIFCYLWNQPTGIYYYNAKPINLDGMATRYNIEQALKEIGAKITPDDFFYFFEVSHGAYWDSSQNLPWANKGSFTIYASNPANDQLAFFQLSEMIGTYMGNEWSRGVFVFASCYSGHAMSEIHYSSTKQNSIVISSARANEIAIGWLVGGFLTGRDDDHAEFLHDDDYQAFTESLGSSSVSNSILQCYYNGYQAAIHEDIPFYDDFSHPLIDDNWDGVGHEKGSMGNDGTFALYTIL